VRDITLGETIDFKFTTRDEAGLPTVLTGSPAVSAYVGNGTTQITAGITLTASFDSVTGLNNVRVVASSGNGFANQTDVSLVITTGTVDSVSVVGEVVGEFTIGRSAVYTLGIDIDSGFDALADHLSNMDGADATLSVGTLAAIADKALGRNVAGGSDGGRTVTRMLRRLGNRVTLSGSAGDTSRTMTVYAEDDTTVAYTATVTLDTGGGHPNDVNPV
jgi:hypothetical protein